MCVCIYIYIYIYTHTHTHTHNISRLRVNYSVQKIWAFVYSRLVPPFYISAHTVCYISV
jgi:hypothetical protein